MQLEKNTEDLLILEDNHAEAYNIGFEAATKDFKEQIPSVIQKIWACCLEQVGVHEDSLLRGQNQVPVGLDILMTQTKMDIENGVMTSNAVAIDVADPNQKEAGGCIPVESPFPVISTVRPAPSIVDITTKDAFDDTADQ